MNPPLYFISLGLALGCAAAVANSGDFKEVHLDASDHRIRVEFNAPVSSALLGASRFEVAGKDRRGIQHTLAVKRASPRGLPLDEKGEEIGEGISADKIHYKSVAIEVRDGIKPGWAYQVRFKLPDDNPSLLKRLGLEEGVVKTALVSDWVEAGGIDPSKTLSWRLAESFNGPSLDLDVRNSGNGASDIGVDFDLQLFSWDPFWFHGDHPKLTGAAGIRAGSKGHLKNESSSVVAPKLDNITSFLEGFVDVLLVSEKHLATLVSPQLSLKNEATQNFDTSTYTLGAGASFDLGFVFPVQQREDEPTLVQKLNFLDVSKRKRPIEAPRLFAGYDRVFNADDSNRSLRTGDSAAEFNRLTFGAAWGLPVLNDRSYLTLSWDGFRDLDAVRDEFKSFVEIKLTYALTEPKDGKKAPVNLLVKYVKGSLPPNYGSESAVVAGLSISLK